MKILHLVEYLELGGIERLLSTFSDYANDKAVFFAYEMDGPKGISLEMARKGRKVYFYKKQAGHDGCVVKKLKKIIKEENISTIHTHDFGPMEYALRLKLLFPKIQLVHTQHTLHHFLSNKKYTYFFQFAALFYKKIVCVSESVKKALQKKFVIPLRNLEVIYNGIALEKFPWNESVYFSNILRLVGVSRISAEKNLEHTIKSLYYLKQRGIEFEYRHIGSGEQEYEEKIKKSVTDLGLDQNIKFLGHQENVSPILVDAQVFISSSFTEGHPISVVEALASGLTCFLSDIDPHAIFKNSNVHYFSLENGSMLVDLLSEYTEDSEKYGASLARGRDFIKNYFSIETTLDEYMKIYR